MNNRKTSPKSRFSFYTNDVIKIFFGNEEKVRTRIQIAYILFILMAHSDTANNFFLTISRLSRQHYKYTYNTHNVLDIDYHDINVNISCEFSKWLSVIRLSLFSSCVLFFSFLSASKRSLPLVQRHRRWWLLTGSYRLIKTSNELHLFILFSACLPLLWTHFFRSSWLQAFCLQIISFRMCATWYFDKMRPRMLIDLSLILCTQMYCWRFEIYHTWPYYVKAINEQSLFSCSFFE